MSDASTPHRTPQALAAWRRLKDKPFGAWLYSRIICRRAPYFGSIRPRITALEPGLCEAHIRDRRAVHNHIGTVHAIALCNLAELCAGVVTDASLPPGMRWIPKGMTVEYRRKAAGTMHARAVFAFPPDTRAEGFDLPVLVDVRDDAGEVVFHAEIRMWLSPRKG